MESNAKKIKLLGLFVWGLLHLQPPLLKIPCSSKALLMKSNKFLTMKQAVGYHSLDFRKVHSSIIIPQYDQSFYAWQITRLIETLTLIEI